MNYRLVLVYCDKKVIKQIEMQSLNKWFSSYGCFRFVATATSHLICGRHVICPFLGKVNET